MSSNTKTILFLALAVLAVILLCEMASAQYGGGRGYYGGRGYGGRGYGGRGYGGYGYGGRGYGGRGYGGYGGRGYGGYGGRGYGGYGRGTRTTSYGSSYGDSSNNDQNYPSDSFTSHDLSQSDNDHDTGSYGADGYFSSYDVFTASSSAAQPSTATVSVAQPSSVQPDRQSDWQLEQESSRGNSETPRLLWNAADGPGQQAPLNVYDGPYDMITGNRLPEGQLDNRQAMMDRSGNFEGRQRTSGSAPDNKNNNKKQQDSLIASLNATPTVPTSTTTAAPEYVMINPTRNNLNRNNRPNTTS